MTAKPIVIGALVTVPKVGKGNGNSLNSDDESRPSKLQHSCHRPEDRKESRRHEETFCLTDSKKKRPLANDRWKKSGEMIIEIIICDFKIQTGYLITTRRPDLVIVNKKREPAE